MECPKSNRADGKHSIKFDGDDPYTICIYCKKMWDAISGDEVGVVIATPKAPRPTEPSRAVKSGMSQAEYDTWMFLADKETGTKPYTFLIRQSDLTEFLGAYKNQVLDMVKAEMPEHVPVQNAAHCSGCSSNNGYNHALAQVTAAIERVRGNK